jgi:hypothetical protein
MKKGHAFVSMTFFQQQSYDYSEKVNGIVTVVLPDFTLLNVQLPTALLI